MCHSYTAGHYAVSSDFFFLPSTYVDVNTLLHRPRLTTHSDDLIHRSALERACLSSNHLDLGVTFSIDVLYLFSSRGRVEYETHDIIADIALNDNLILALRVLRDTTARGKLAGKLLGRLFEIDAEKLETVDMGLMFSLCPFRAFDRDLLFPVVSWLFSFSRPSLDVLPHTPLRPRYYQLCFGLSALLVWTHLFLLLLRLGFLLCLLFSLDSILFQLLLLLHRQSTNSVRQ